LSREKKETKNRKKQTIPLPESNVELINRLEETTLQRKMAASKAISSSLIMAILSALSALGGIIFYANQNYVSQHDINAIFLSIGIFSTMIFAFPVFYLKTDYLKVILKKTPTWVLDSLWGSYMASCGIIFLTIFILFIISGMIDPANFYDVIVTGGLMIYSFRMAIRSLKNKERKKDVVKSKKAMASLLRSKRGGLLGRIIIGVLLYAFPLSSIFLLGHGITSFSLYASLIITIVAGLALIALLRFQVRQILVVQIDDLEKVMEKVKSADAIKYFEKNLASYDKIIRLGHS
jgi:hypothetical protein